MEQQPCSLNGIEFDALFNETASYTAETPEYAVESGVSVSDNIAIKPVTIEITAYLSNTPVTWLARHGTGRVEAVVAELENLYFSRQLVSFQSSTTSYSNMSIISLSVPKDETNKSSREVKITLKQVNVVSSQTTSIPADYVRGGATGENAGTASTGRKGSGSTGGKEHVSTGGSNRGGKEESKEKASILYNLTQKK